MIFVQYDNRIRIGIYKYVTYMKCFSVISKYINESIEEFNHVTWPTKKQTIRLTIMVVSFVAVSAALIGLIDFIFKFLVTLT